MKPHTRSVAGAAVALWAVSGCATDSDDAGQDPAEFESTALMALVTNLRPEAHWIGDEDRFWMKQETGDGARFVVVHAASGKQEPSAGEREGVPLARIEPAFDHARLAASLADAGLEDADADNLPITSLGLEGNGLLVTTAGGVFACSADAAECAKGESPPPSYVVPNANHGGAAAHPYIVKRQRRFFEEHLGGPVP